MYGRLTPDTTLPSEVQTEQGRIRVTYTVRRYSNDVLFDSARVAAEENLFPPERRPTTRDKRR